MESPQRAHYNGIFAAMLQFEKIRWPLKVVGLMSGTSLDGLDLAACTFTLQEGRWSYTIEHATTLPYSGEWKNRLQNLHLADGQELAETHAQLGHYFGQSVKNFCLEHAFSPDLVGSHGHTVFHQPSKGFTLQIGDGAAVAAVSGVDTVCDFRTKDIALGGQGAPLVPVGDRLLFSEYAACLNLGGIANISFERDGERKAWDICPVNMILNHLAAYEGQEYDDGGKLAMEGNVLPELLENLNALPFYVENGPRSLGREWFEKVFLPQVKNAEGNTKDKLRTVTEHIARQITTTVNGIQEKGPVLVTGGGAFNRFLIDRMNLLSVHPLTVPSAMLVNFKEALVFALLAGLYAASMENVLASATGASRNSTGGALYRAV
jgi:anhydro-N-acetylmuramic acid kinase